MIAVAIFVLPLSARQLIIADIDDIGCGIRMFL